MSNENYPTECTFCYRKFKINPCLLPHILAKNIQLPTDHDERTMELTELHCHFNNDYFRTAVNMTRWQLTSSDELSQSAPSATKNWLHDLHPDSQTHPMSEIVTLDTQSNVAEGAPLAQSLETQDTPKTPAPKAESLIKDVLTDDEITRVKTPSPTEAKSPLTESNLKQHETDSATRQNTSGLDTNEILHLADDIAISATCAQTLRKVKRDQTSLSQFMNSLSHEIDIINEKGKTYVPFTSTKLDHPVALARELLARHTVDQLYDWLQAKQPVCNTHHSGCLLNHLGYPINAKPSKDDVRIDNILFAFARNALDSLQRDSKHKKHALNAVKALLEERKMMFTFEFALNAPLEKLILDDKTLLSHEKNKRSTKSQPTKKAPVPLKESEPPIPKQTQTLLNDYLFSSVQSELLRDSTLKDSIRENIIDPKSMTLICHKIIQFNPRWNTPTFSVTLHILTQALNQLEIECRTMEKLQLVPTTTNVLTKLRDTQNKT